MKRRDALKRSTFLLGCGLSAGTIASIVSGCKTDPVTTQSSDTFLSNDLMEVLAEVVETIIPTTDTPGAKEAKVHEFIDFRVKHNFTAEEQGMFQNVIEEIAAGNGKSFLEMNTEEREAHLLSFDQSIEEINPYEVIQGMTAQGFFTSEIGGTQVLAYDPIPGEYIGCIPLSDVGKNWALR